jgi:hypothetical protein
LKLHPNKVANSIIILGAVQAPNGYTARIRMVTVTSEKGSRDPIGEQLALSNGRLRLVLRWHFMRLEFAQNLFKDRPISQSDTLICINSKIQAALLFLAVAIDTELVQEGPNVSGKIYFG